MGYGPIIRQADLTTLLTRLSAVRAGYLDNLSAGAVATAAALAAKSSVLSVQFGNIALAGPSDATATITAVGSKAVCHWLGTTVDTATPYPSKEDTYATLTNATTVTAGRRTGDAAIACQVKFVVVDYA